MSAACCDLHQEGPAAVHITGLPDRPPFLDQGHPALWPVTGALGTGPQEGPLTAAPPRRRWALPGGTQEDSASKQFTPALARRCTHMDPSHPHTRFHSSHTHALHMHTQMHPCPDRSHTSHTQTHPLLASRCVTLLHTLAYMHSLHKRQQLRTQTDRPTEGRAWPIEGAGCAVAQPGGLPRPPPLQPPWPCTLPSDAASSFLGD